MTKYAAVLCFVGVALLVAAPAQALPTADEVLKAMADASAKAKTLEVDSISSVKTDKGTVHSTGHAVTMKSEEDGKTLQKLNIAMKSTMEANGVTLVNETRMVSDGHVVWEEMKNSTIPDVVQVVKAKADGGVGAPGVVATPEEQLQQIKSAFEFGAVTEDTIDGHKVYVLEGTVKTDSPQFKQLAAMISKLKYCVDEDSSNIRRVVMYDPAGAEFSRVDMTNQKINEPVDPKLFEYVPPAGAQIRDMTATTPAPTPTPAPEPAPAPAK